MAQLDTQETIDRGAPAGNDADPRPCPAIIAAAEAADPTYLDVLVKHEAWRLVMRGGLIGALAALAVSSSVAQAAGGGGGLPASLYGSSQPNPHWAATEEGSAGDPIAWLQRILRGGTEQQASRATERSGAGHESRLR